jgi:hypothetical protein
MNPNQSNLLLLLLHCIVFVCAKGIIHLKIFSAAHISLVSEIGVVATNIS